jgi:hypothetical protein
MSSCVEMLRGMLTGRTIATADVPAFGATPQMKPPSASCEALDAAIAARRHIRIYFMTLSFHGRLLWQQRYFAGAILIKRSMRPGGVPQRDPASDRDGQSSCSHGFNHICQIFRVLFGNEGDGADPGILVCVGGRAGYRGERTVFIHLSHKILRRLSSDCVGDDIDWLEIRECRWSIECSQAISAKLEPEALEIAETHL